MAHRLLIVEDESNLRRVITDYFSMRDFVVREACDGLEAMAAITQTRFDIVLLDIMMPRLDGLAVCRKIRQKYDVPVIFITAIDDDESRLDGYECGADDYIAKPFSLSVLFAKVQVLLKRYNGSLVQNGIIRMDGVEIEPARHAVSVDGQSIALAPKEYELLLYLVENKNLVLSRDQILDRIWGPDYVGYDRAVDTHIKKLRAALGSRGHSIVTVVKAGYTWRI